MTVGLTSDEPAAKTKRHDRYVRPFPGRKAALADERRSFAAEHGRTLKIWILSEPTDIATGPQFDAVVVFPETEPGGHRINMIRKDHDLEPLQFVVVDPVRAEDGEIISSTRIAHGEIDEHGTPTPRAVGRIYSCT